MQDKKYQETKVWDNDLLLARVLHNKEIYDAVLKAFIEDVPQTMNKLIEEVAKQGFIKIAALAHNIKGSALNVTANVLAEIVSDIEIAAKEKDIKKVKRLCPQLVEQLNLLLAEFTT